MDFQGISAIIFIFLMFIFLVLKKKKITIQKVISPLLYFALYRTKLGLKLMDKFAKKYPKTLNALAYVSITLGFIGMALIAFSLIHNLYKVLMVPTAVAAVVPVLPFKVKGAFYVPFSIGYYVYSS